jgi:glycosyltransferase involved in cell wall biosynthesis
MLAAGHQPTVAVATPELATPWTIERIDGVEVLRIRTPRTKDVGMVRRALAECLLPFAMLRGLRRSPLARVQWDGIVWYSPTIFFGPMVRAVKRQCNCRSYLILRDLFPDWAVDTGVMRRGLAYRFFKWIEQRQYAVADVIGVQTPANIPLVRADSHGGAHIEVLNNWLAAPEIGGSGIDLARGPLGGKTIFVYAGNMGAAQGMDCLIELAIGMRTHLDVGFVFVGRGSEVPRLQAMLRDHALSNVLFLDEIASEHIPGLLAQCHVGLIALDPRHTTHNIPGKLLSYLRAGLPVLARINAGNDLEALINDSGVGRVVAREAPDELRRHAEALVIGVAERKAMAQRGLRLAEDMFSPAEAVRRVILGLES